MTDSGNHHGERAERFVIPIAIVMLLTLASEASAGTITKIDFLCRNLETLKELDRLSHSSDPASQGPRGTFVQFVNRQVDAGECVSTGNSKILFVNAKVRIEKRVGEYIQWFCITREMPPSWSQTNRNASADASDPCEWISAAAIEE